MSEPKRWLTSDSDAPEGARELLGAADVISPLPEAVDRRVSRRLTALLALPFGLGGWLISGKAAAIGAAAVAVSTVVAVGVVVVGTQSRTGDRASGSQSRVAAARDSQSARAPEQPEPDQAFPRVTEALEGHVPVEQERRSSRARPRLNRAPEVGASEQNIAAEAALLEQARRHLSSSPKKTLEFLRAYDRRFARPGQRQLVMERRVVEIDALYRLGRRRTARQQAKRFLARYPNSVYVERVQELLRGPRPLGVDKAQGRVESRRP